MNTNKFRAWSNVDRLYIEYTDNIVISAAGTIAVVEYPLGDGWTRVLSDTDDYCMERFSGLSDRNGKEGFAGDIRKYHGKIYKVVDDNWRFRFERNIVEFGENESVPVDEDSMYESELMGTVHENPEFLYRE